MMKSYHIIDDLYIKFIDETWEVFYERYYQVMKYLSTF